jgi:uncharacterized protein YciI
MSADSAARLDELLGKMLKLKLFVIFSRGKGLDLKPHLLEHLEYMVALERQGKLFASGPMGDPRLGNGMTIVRAESEDEARAIASNDPFFRHGLREFSVEPWTVMEGALRVTVNFSDGTMHLS